LKKTYRTSKKIIVIIPILVLIGTIFLSLLGYGAAGAIETMFGVPRELTYSSPLGLLHLSGHAIAGFMDMSVNFWAFDGFVHLVRYLTALGFSLTIVMFLARAALVRSVWQKNVIDKLPALKRSRGCQLISRFYQWVKRERCCLIPAVFFSAIPWVIVLILAVTALSFSIVPVIGYSAARAQFHKWIVNSEFCSPLASRAERIEPLKKLDSKATAKEITITPCLSLWKDKALVVKGRHITSTDRHVILFNPESGKVYIEPIEGVSMEVSGLLWNALQNAATARP
jgi:hypothetical protein